MEQITCPWEPSSYLFFSSNVPDLVHYSHVTAIFAAMAIALFIFFNSPRSTISRLFLLFATLFSIWVTLDIILWATNQPSVVMFSWSVQILLEPLAYATAFYLFYKTVVGSWPNFKTNLLLFLLVIPIIILLPTTLNLQGLLLSACESIEGPLAKYYTYLVNAIFLVLILITGTKYIPKMPYKTDRLTSLYFGIGLVTFLIAFTSGNILSSFTDDWTISQYGLFAMPIFASLIAYSIVKFNAFNVKTIGAQMLVVSLWALVGSLLFVVKSDTSRIVAGITLFFTTISGFLLVRSVKKEVRQREQLEKLTLDLEVANERLKELDKAKSEFVSIASHQLRSPLTAIRGYASMLAEGSFGQMPQKAQESAKRIEESAKLMAMSIEDYLNVSRIESGNMKYNLTDFNIVEMTSNLCDDLRPEAMSRNLILLFRSDVSGKGIVNADVGKTNQIIHNLINNSIKYTPKGSISVFVRDDVQTKRIYIDITDTGIGMSKETMDKLFGKFSRANNANSVNTSGTGLGLYVALKMAEAMGGTITCTSQGDGKGSTFTFELPLAM